MFWLRVVFAASDRVWQAKSSCKRDCVISDDVRRNVHTQYIRQQGEAAGKGKKLPKYTDNARWF